MAAFLLYFLSVAAAVSTARAGIPAGVAQSLFANANSVGGKPVCIFGPTGSQATLKYCDVHDSQQTFTPSGNGYASAAGCLDGGALTAGAPLKIGVCDGSPAQAWTYTHTGQLTTAGDLCIATAAAAAHPLAEATPGAALVVTACGASPTQAFIYQTGLSPPAPYLGYVISLLPTGSLLCIDRNSATHNNFNARLKVCSAGQQIRTLSMGMAGGKLVPSSGFPSDQFMIQFVTATPTPYCLAAECSARGCPALPNQVSATQCATTLTGSQRNLMAQGQVFKYSLKGNLVSYWTTVWGNNVCVAVEGTLLRLTDCSYKTFTNKWVFSADYTP